MGLAVSPFWAPPGGLPQATIGLVLTTIVFAGRTRLPIAGAIVVFIAAALTGTGAGRLRLDAIDGGAFTAAPGTTLELDGFTTAVAKRSRGVTRVPVQAERGKIQIEAGRAPGRIATGSRVLVRGVVHLPPEYLRPNLRRQGISRLLHTDRIRLVGGRRGGVEGWVDAIRNRAESALEREMPDREAALARGFVLGQDDSIDSKTTDDFRASGLAHLLAVSGQNVVLLGLLAIPFMAMAGLRPGTRLAVVAGLILIYVPLAGAGASIQRAGVMGLAGLISVAATRPGSRIYALALAATVTLAINPRASSDVGWQLSFAAVIGIYLLTGPLQKRLAVLIGGGGWRTALADAAAVTTAATVATAPLMAFHFEQVSATTLVANLLAFPAVAPAMWLGMIAATVGQLGTWLAVPFNLLNSLLLAYVAQIAAWFGGASWTRLDLKVTGPIELGVIYMALAAGCSVILGLVTPRRLGLDAEPRRRRRARSAAATALVAVMAAGFVIGPGLLSDGRRQLDDPPAGGARVEVLDVGQGDAILIRPDSGDPVLVDGGPPGDDISGALESAGVDDLAAVVLTHDHLDHFGGLYDVFGSHGVGQFLFDRLPGSLLALARDSGAATRRISQGESFTFSGIRAEVLWPPMLPQGDAPPEDPNVRSIVLELEIGRFRMLLTGDAEEEAAPVDPGPVDVLKVAHHGSEDGALPALLGESTPSLALISVGQDNRYGHPSDTTLDELRAAGTPTMRTDLSGTISVVVEPRGFSVEAGR